MISRYMVLWCASCIGLAGCAGPWGWGDSQHNGPVFRDPKMSLQEAQDIIVPGKFTKADVTMALGNAAVITFDSGFEVWVYRVKSGETAITKAEFVILFAPSGVVKKTRIRLPYDKPA